MKERSCTDVFCLLLIICMWLAMTVGGALAIVNGDPYRLISPINDTGEICGYTGDVVNQPYFYTVLTNSVGVCVGECPIVDIPLTNSDPDNYYCLSAVYNTFNNNKPAIRAYIQSNCFTNNQYDLTLDCGCNIMRKTTSVFHRCIFEDPIIREQYFPIDSTYFVSFISDIFTARSVVFGFGILFAICLCFLWTHLIHYEIFGKILCWTSIILIVFAMAAVTAVANTTADEWQKEDPPTHSGSERRALRAFSGIMLIATFLFGSLMIFLRKQINLSIKVMALAASAVEDMPLIVFTPLVQLSGFILFLMPWFVYVIYVASDGHFEKQPMSTSAANYGISNPEMTVFVPAHTVGGRLWFLVGCLYWSMNFCAMLGTLVLALCVAMWYFTKPEERATKIGNRTINEAYRIAFRYHLGTVAFGAFLVAIVQFIRTVLLYIEKHSEKIKKNPIAKYVFCCLNCCLLCLEKIIKFISKNAYIQTAIFGTKFLSSCKAAFYAIARNIARIGSLHIASTVALFIGKVFVCCICAACAYYILDTEYQNRISGLIAPTMLVLLLSLIVVTMFMDVFHMCIDTVIMCYITDEECNDGKPAFATVETQQFITDHGVSKKDKLYFEKMNSKTGTELTKVSKTDDTTITKI